MNDLDFREMRRIPLPQGDEPDSWMIDGTKWTLLRQTYGSGRAPYNYSACGTRVRLVMPAKGLARTLDIHRKLADHAERLHGEMHDEVGVSHTMPPDAVATMVLVNAVFEEDSPYRIVTVWPNGRVLVFAHNFPGPDLCIGSWHPDSPGRGE